MCFLKIVCYDELKLEALNNTVTEMSVKINTLNELLIVKEKEIADQEITIKIFEDDEMEVLNQQMLNNELRENNQYKIHQMVNTNSIKNFYLNCEGNECKNTVSANSKNRKWYCAEYCNGCKSVICYECKSRADRYCKVNLGSKNIEIRDDSDKRYNTMISIDKVTTQGNDYCESCAFENLKNGLCMIKTKIWEERKAETQI